MEQVNYIRVGLRGLTVAAGGSDARAIAHQNFHNSGCSHPLEVIDVQPIEPTRAKNFADDLDDLDQDCPTCGGVGYLSIAYTDDAEPCPNCNPNAGEFPPILTPQQRRQQFQAWAEWN